VAAVVEVESVTTVPPDPAGPVSVTVPVDELPPSTVVGFRLNDAIVAGVIVRVADSGVPFKNPVMTAPVTAFTPEVVTVNVALDCPPGIVTEEGTVAAAFPLESWTDKPLPPVAPLSVTVPVEGVPPRTVEGFKLTDDRTAGVIVSVAVWLRPGIAVMSASV
jgi:hypothetical protein